MRRQINQTDSRVNALEHPAHDPDSLYQADEIVAKFISGRMSSNRTVFEFTEIYNANTIKFSEPIEFRGLVLKRQSHNIDVGMGFTPIGMVGNIMNYVMCSVISGKR